MPRTAERMCAAGGGRRWRRHAAASPRQRTVTEAREPEGQGSPLGRAVDGRPAVEPTVRKNFADTAFWNAALDDRQGRHRRGRLHRCPRASPPGRSRSGPWATAPGSARARPRSSPPRDLLVRLQAPRFFVQKDEVVLSANVHNYLKTEKEVQVVLELEGGTLAAARTRRRRPSRSPPAASSASTGGSRSTSEGQAIVRMKALTDEESDAMQMTLPVPTSTACSRWSRSPASIRPDKDDGAGRRSTCRPSAALNADAARSPLLADPGRRHGRCPAVPGRLSLRLHRADAQPLPAHGHHAEGPAST